MKRERQIKVYLGIIIVIFVLMTFLLPLGKYTSNLLSLNKDINIPIGMSINNEIYDICKEVFNTANKKYIVIYQDGLNDTIFKKETYYDCTIDNIPKFKGNTNRSNYKFIGWYIERDKDTITYTANYEKSS